MIRRGPNTTNLSKAYIESKVSQELIVSRYLGIDLDVVKDCIAHSHLIESVFREDDTNKSMGIQFNNKGRLKVRDFGGFGFFDDVYGVVAYVLSIVYGRKLDTNKKQDFYFILKHIAMTFADIIEGKEVDPDVKNNITSALNVAKKKKAIIEIAFRSWNKHDSELWKKWNINLTYLDTHYVYAVDQYYINRAGADSVPDYFYSEKDPCYAYFIGRNFKRGEVYWKLYFPLRDRKRKDKKQNLKFITNCNGIEGWYNLEDIKYDYIIITKSSKDRLCIGSHLLAHPLYGRDNRKLNIGIINLPSENYKLHKEEYDIICSRCISPTHIYSLLDFDTTGRLGAQHLMEYGIKYLFITRGEFGLPNYKSKDFAELVENYSDNEVQNFVKQTLTYIQLKYERYQEFDENDLPY